MTESYPIRGVCSGCKKAGVIVSHLPKTSRVCSLFLLGGRGGVIFAVLYPGVKVTPLILFKVG